MLLQIALMLKPGIRVLSLVNKIALFSIIVIIKLIKVFMFLLKLWKQLLNQIKILFNNEIF
jgi:hypothetical protein